MKTIKFILFVMLLLPFSIVSAGTNVEQTCYYSVEVSRYTHKKVTLINECDFSTSICKSKYIFFNPTGYNTDEYSLPGIVMKSNNSAIKYDSKLDATSSNNMGIKCPSHLYVDEGNTLNDYFFQSNVQDECITDSSKCSDISGYALYPLASVTINAYGKSKNYSSDKLQDYYNTTDFHFDVEETKCGTYAHNSDTHTVSVINGKCYMDGSTSDSGTCSSCPDKIYYVSWNVIVTDREGGYHDAGDGHAERKYGYRITYDSAHERIEYELPRDPGVNLEDSGKYKDIVSCRDADYKYIKECGCMPASLTDLTSRLYMLIKIAAPALLLVIGGFDLIKAMSAQDESAINKARQKLIKKFIAAAAVFLIFTLIQFLVSTFANNVSDTMKCLDYILNGYVA